MQNIKVYCFDLVIFEKIMISYYSPSDTVEIRENILFQFEIAISYYSFGDGSDGGGAGQRTCVHKGRMSNVDRRNDAFFDHV
jgi:hypothetical protein